jgi:hypothetical protein
VRPAGDALNVCSKKDLTDETNTGLSQFIGPATRQVAYSDDDWLSRFSEVRTTVYARG